MKSFKMLADRTQTNTVLVQSLNKILEIHTDFTHDIGDHAIQSQKRR